MKKVARSQLTVKQAYRMFEQQYCRRYLRLVTIQGYAHSIYGFIDRVGDIPLKELTSQLIKADLRELAKASPYTPNRLKAALSSMCKWLVLEDYIAVNPCAGLPKYREIPKKRYLSEAEVSKLFAAMKKSNCKPATKSMLKLYLLTGCRASELAKLKIEELDLEKKRWLLPVERSKNKREHLIPLSDKSCGILRACIGERTEGFVFLNDKGKPQEVWNTNQTLRRLLIQARVEPATLRDLRRTTATLIGSLGYPSWLIGKVLNHSAIGVTEQVYALYDYEKEKREALEVLASKLSILLL